ncbi:hypothetical protein FVE85_4668 [Porphyridium purpureum]|uniref:Uncharacterized protein n=1 Tax=Porphyridium purpureum TaxID=35688 RepID=A0A5J4YPV1_PORPP|nr:hypothetical protein FVE85_4668 [Porphyridium purpureum]|eukprot:POR3972..scf236_6
MCRTVTDLMRLCGYSYSSPLLHATVLALQSQWRSKRHSDTSRSNLLAVQASELDSEGSVRKRLPSSKEGYALRVITRDSVYPAALFKRLCSLSESLGNKVTLSTSPDGSLLLNGLTGDEMNALLDNDVDMLCEATTSQQGGDANRSVSHVPECLSWYSLRTSPPSCLDSFQSLSHRLQPTGVHLEVWRGTELLMRSESSADERRTVLRSAGTHAILTVRFGAPDMDTSVDIYACDLGLLALLDADPAAQGSLLGYNVVLGAALLTENPAWKPHDGRLNVAHLGFVETESDVLTLIAALGDLSPECDLLSIVEKFTPEKLRRVLIARGVKLESWRGAVESGHIAEPSAVSDSASFTCGWIPGTPYSREVHCFRMMLDGSDGISDAGEQRILSAIRRLLDVYDLEIQVLPSKCSLDFIFRNFKEAELRNIDALLGEYNIKFHGTFPFTPAPSMEEDRESMPFVCTLNGMKAAAPAAVQAAHISLNSVMKRLNAWAADQARQTPSIQLRPVTVKLEYSDLRRSARGVCALGEIGLLQRQLASENGPTFDVYLGGSSAGDRAGLLWHESLAEDDLLASLEPILKNWLHATASSPDLSFGDFCSTMDFGGSRSNNSLRTRKEKNAPREGNGNADTGSDPRLALQVRTIQRMRMAANARNMSIVELADEILTAMLREEIEANEATETNGQEPDHIVSMANSMSHSCTCMCNARSQVKLHCGTLSTECTSWHPAGDVVYVRIITPAHSHHAGFRAELQYCALSRH